MTGLLDGLREGVDFSSHQGAGAGDVSVAGDADRGSLGAVGRAEGVVDIDVAEGGVLLREFVVTLLFANVAAAVFEHHDMAGPDLDAINPVGDERHVATQKLAHAAGNAREAVGRRHGAFRRTAEVAHHHHGGTGVKRGADGGNAGHKTGFVGNAAVFIVRRVEVAADQDALAGEKTVLGKLFKSQNVHDLFSERECGALRRSGNIKCESHAEDADPGHGFHDHRNLPFTWRPSSRRPCQACGWRSPIRCRTRQ